jgi:phospholipid/cholesterol/gamma-HCH transport system substrate-binding protein
MGEQTKNMLIGLFVVAACALIIWIILFLKPSVGNGRETLYVRFANINQIGIGTRVLFAGRPVGEVVGIQEIHDARKKPLADSLGEIYYYQLILKVDSSVKVYDTDEVVVQTSGLLGEKSIAIIPRIPPKGTPLKLVTDQPIYADSTDPIESAFHELSSLSKEMKHTFSLVSHWISKNSDSLTHTVSAFRETLDEIKIAVADFNQKKIIDDIKETANQITATAKSLDVAVNQMQESNAFVNAGTTLENFKEASGDIRIVARDIASGKGTLGKLITGDDFYLRLSGLIGKADTLMNDLNHYGLLFHLNKSWQRQRAKQISVVNALNTPANFRNYFQHEVSEINTAMSRLSTLIERAETGKDKEVILNNPQFLKDFRDLMNQADALSDNLKLYNQQLSEIIKP